MARYIRNTLVLFKVESTPGTDATPTGAADAVLVSDLSINPLDANNIDAIAPLIARSFADRARTLGT